MLVLVWYQEPVAACRIALDLLLQLTALHGFCFYRYNIWDSAPVNNRWQKSYLSINKTTPHISYLPEGQSTMSIDARLWSQGAIAKQDQRVDAFAGFFGQVDANFLGHNLVPFDAQYTLAAGVHGYKDADLVAGRVLWLSMIILCCCHLCCASYYAVVTPCILTLCRVQCCLCATVWLNVVCLGDICACRCQQG